jgi:hypothetical protein
MKTDREIQETVARCVAAIVYYHNCGRTTRAREVFEADVAGIRDRLRVEGAPGREVGPQVRAELLARYEPRLASALFEEFVAALTPPRSSPASSGEYLGKRLTDLSITHNSAAQFEA